MLRRQSARKNRVAPEQQSYEDQMDQRALATATRECVGLIGDPSGRMSGDRENWSVLQKKDLLLLWQSSGKQRRMCPGLDS